MVVYSLKLFIAFVTGLTVTGETVLLAVETFLVYLVLGVRTAVQTDSMTPSVAWLAGETIFAVALYTPFAAGETPPVFLIEPISTLFHTGPRFVPIAFCALQTFLLGAGLTVWVARHAFALETPVVCGAFGETD